ncbi:adenylate kinase [uncultured Desulfovibrio sp.]|uniref:adenylate kinase n=1 Tax=uncultured Desulfovibrio sp. TaxID=167968 RepID=UPI00261B6691|nr:adenylate kinase [uncultured Desulfovibrio sp.]
MSFVQRSGTPEPGVPPLRDGVFCLLSGKPGESAMVVIITGATHTGKTLLAQRLLETYHFPYLSVDLLKMGLIRSGRAGDLTPYDDEALEGCLWPIVREMIKTAVENGQSLIVEGGYIPHDWKASFEESYIKEIRYYCLVMSKQYIMKNFSKIKMYANVMEKRISDDGCTMQYLMEENERYRSMCEAYGYACILVEDDYHPDIVL